MQQGYDLVGDLHGHAKELVELLGRLGYQPSSQGFQHPSRKLIFLGDFIDRGSEHLELLDIVIEMVGNQNAYAVMGNHEFNALAYHTQHEGEFLRAHSPKNQRQHQAFLDAYADQPRAREKVLDFFWQLPLWIEIDGIRVVHACWHDHWIDWLEKNSEDGRLTKELLVQASKPGTDAYNAIETVLKGVEIALPEGKVFEDKDGNSRSEVRVKWWHNQASKLSEIVLPEGLNLGEGADLPIDGLIPRYPDDSPLCFIGHYWLNGDPKPLTAKLTCLDYSVAKDGGKLVAYRYSGEDTLIQDNFVFV